MRLLIRLLPVACLAMLLVPAVSSAATRMPVGFQDDPTFRWDGQTGEELDLVQEANASIIRTTANWRVIAPKRPANAAQPFSSGYRLGDLDDMIRKAQQRGIEVMITIWGTPAWANGGKAANVPPKRPGDLTNFARALAARYSGRYPGYPNVGRYSIWNEPNLGIFLSTQFDAKGKIISPRVYAGLYRAGYRGIKAGNRTALVAIGETSNQGRDHLLKGAPVSVAPGTFARLLAAQKGLKFDAYATHPYATRPNLPPTQKVRWPNVTLTQLKRFETSIDTWFHRKNIPVWITEYGYETKPAEPHGVSLAQQSSYLSKVLLQLKADPRVQMFIWFVFRDSPENLWQSGLFTQSGVMKPAYKTFTTQAKTIAGQTVSVKPGVPPMITLPVPELAYSSPVGATIGVTYRVFLGAKLVASGQPATRLALNQSISFLADFKPAARKTYAISMEAGDVNGNKQTTTYSLVTGR
jgi:hypothetical protein